MLPLWRAAHLAPLAVALLAACSGDAPLLEVKTQSRSYQAAGRPAAAAVLLDGSVAVSVSSSGTAGLETGIEIFERDGASLRATCVQPLPESIARSTNSALGLARFGPDGDLAVAVDDPGLLLVRGAALRSCGASGYHVPQGSQPGNGAGTFDVTVTADGRHAFTANEYGVAPGSSTPGNVGVVAIERAAGGGFAAGTRLLGRIATGGEAIPGVTLSPDGRRLYVATEIARLDTPAAGTLNPVLGRRDCVQGGGAPRPYGLLTVIDVERAIRAPGPGAIISTVAAGCSPVRMAVSADGRHVWVAARGDDRVLAFDAARLESDPEAALLGFASSGGTAPVGLQLFAGGRLLAVANSNRFGTGQENLAILDVTIPEAAVVVHRVATGKFPRNITVAPDDRTLLLTNFDSRTLQVIRTEVE